MTSADERFRRLQFQKRLMDFFDSELRKIKDLQRFGCFSEKVETLWGDPPLPGGGMC